eukprot:scaffold17620_cov155-Isochrysis_galbana.AAC.2
MGNGSKLEDTLCGTVGRVIEKSSGRGPGWGYGGGPRCGVGRCGLPFTRGRGCPSWREFERGGGSVEG